MHLFDFLPNFKLNGLDAEYPDPSDVTKGPTAVLGMLGERWMYRDSQARKMSDSDEGTCYEGVYQLVRTDPSFSVALGSWVGGRPVFWADKAAHLVTPTATATSIFAGFALNSISAKGNLTMILTEGDVEGLFKSSLTKATPVVNNLCVIDITSSLATLDVLADATAVTWGSLQTQIFCRVAAAVTAGEKSKVSLAGMFKHYVNGVI